MSRKRKRTFNTSSRRSFSAEVAKRPQPRRVRFLETAPSMVWAPYRRAPVYPPLPKAYTVRVPRQFNKAAVAGSSLTTRSFGDASMEHRAWVRQVDECLAQKRKHRRHVFASGMAGRNGRRNYAQWRRC